MRTITRRLIAFVTGLVCLAAGLGYVFYPLEFVGGASMLMIFISQKKVMDIIVLGLLLPFTFLATGVLLMGISLNKQLWHNSRS
ncbi:MAG TPA: hypothetical protein VJB64_02345 [Patescibacteria group bacterium]|nr:hypothetical protein [Patescibacteria group bacterium]